MSEGVTWAERKTGSFSEAAVEGLMSCAGEGAGFIDAVWRVSPIWRARESDIVAVAGGCCIAASTLRWSLRLKMFEVRELPGSLIGWLPRY